MDNPFDKKTQNELHDFFNQMTESINEWMLAKYPRFDATLEEKIKNLEYMQNKVASQNQEMLMKIENEKKNLLEYTQKRIIEFLGKEYPDLSGKLMSYGLNLEAMIKKHEKNAIKIEKQLEKVVSSQTLYEDFYKMRDELKEMRKFVENFTNNFKKLLNVKG